MHITDHELAAASSFVAALAIVGGYLGVRSANRNAVKLAREERTSKRHDELNALKRATYAKYLSHITDVMTLSVEVNNAPVGKPPSVNTSKRFLDAQIAAMNTKTEIDLMAAALIADLATDVFIAARTYTGDTRQIFIRAQAKLQLAMRQELLDGSLPTYSELNTQGDSAVATTESQIRRDASNAE